MKKLGLRLLHGIENEREFAELGRTASVPAQATVDVAGLFCCS